ncbi:MAG: DUF2194 domain-containing protein [Lachnospiraceae bacterium]|nr:DUF2194 domain-containing protein [Lachnospiraceae bacterium]
MTISRSGFITMSITMVAILFLFQFSNVAVKYTTRATTNETRKANTKLSAAKTVLEEHLNKKSTYTTAIIGDETSNEVMIAMEWCVYIKREFCRFSSLEEFDDNFSVGCKLLIVTDEMITTPQHNKILKHVADLGIHIIMTQLPDTNILRSSSILRNLLGIREISPETCKTDGVTLYEGFLLGGKTNYRKLKKTIPYLYLKGGTKKYMVGRLKEQKKEKIKNEDLPPIIWRNQYENSFIFGVNWDFFRDHTALGMYTAMWADANNSFIYPVVNAQSFVTESFPYLSDENLGDIKKNYYHTSRSLSTDVLWPDLVSTLSNTGDKLTGMIAPKLEYNNSQNGTLGGSIDYFFRQTEKISGELGISGTQMAGMPFFYKKLEYDKKNLKDRVPNYAFTSFYPGNMPENIYSKYLHKENTILKDIQTLVLPKKDYNHKIISFYDYNTLCLTKTIDGFSHKDREDLYLRSMETALGYSTTVIDFKKVFYPESEKDDWTKLSKDLSRYLTTHWKEFRECFTQTTISEADQKARQFLTIKYVSFRQNDIINLSLTNFDKEADFILTLTNEEVTSVEGGTYKKIEKDRYLITTSHKDVVIHLQATGATEQSN